MLVLKRLENESIVLRVSGVEIVVTVTECLGRKVKLGFRAPPEVQIYREEVIRQIEKKSAGVPSAPPA